MPPPRSSRGGSEPVTILQGPDPALASLACSPGWAHRDVGQMGRAGNAAPLRSRRAGRIWHLGGRDAKKGHPTLAPASSLWTGTDRRGPEDDRPLLAPVPEPVKHKPYPFRLPPDGADSTVFPGDSARPGASCPPCALSVRDPRRSLARRQGFAFCFSSRSSAACSWARVYGKAAMAASSFFMARWIFTFASRALSTHSECSPVRSAICTV